MPRIWIPSLPTEAKIASCSITKYSSQRYIASRINMAKEMDEDGHSD